MNQRAPMPEPMLGRLVGVDQLARELGISRHTVYSWVSQRRIPFLKVGRLLRFDLAAISTWLHSNHEPAFTLEPDTGRPLEDDRCTTRPERRS